MPAALLPFREMAEQRDIKRAKKSNAGDRLINHPFAVSPRHRFARRVLKLARSRIFQLEKKNGLEPCDLPLESRISRNARNIAIDFIEPRFPASALKLARSRIFQLEKKTDSNLAIYHLESRISRNARNIAIDFIEPRSPASAVSLAAPGEIGENAAAPAENSVAIGV